MSYTKEASNWFDLSLISAFGNSRADELKFENRRTYQDLIFEGMGLKFAGEEYFLPPTAESELRGDIAIASEAGPVWPMKKWAHYEWLKTELESRGLRVVARERLIDQTRELIHAVYSFDEIPFRVVSPYGSRL